MESKKVWDVEKFQKKMHRGLMDLQGEKERHFLSKTGSLWLQLVKFQALTSMGVTLL
jgi:hypothetical protein